MNCTVCEHRDRTDIDVRLAQGETVAILAAMFALPQSALKQHQREHANQVTVQVMHQPTTVLLQLERVINDAWVVVELGKGEKDENGNWLIEPRPKLVLDGLELVGKSHERLVKMAKELAMFKQGMVPREAFERLTSVILSALEPFPEALTAVKYAIAEVEL